MLCFLLLLKISSCDSQVPKSAGLLLGPVGSNLILVNYGNRVFLES